MTQDPYVLGFYFKHLFWILIGFFSYGMLFNLIKKTDRLWIELIVIVTIPSLLGVTGLSTQLESIFYGVDIAFAIMVPVLGFLLMLNLHRFTNLRFNRPFAGFFVMIFTLATAGFISLAEMASDLYLGTNLLVNNQDLMRDFLSIFSGGIVMGFFFSWFMKTKAKDIIHDPNQDLVEDYDAPSYIVSFLLEQGVGDKGGRWAPLTSRLLQGIILIFIVVGLVIGEIRWMFSSFICLIITFTPTIVTRNLQIYLPPLVNLLIVLALFLHVMGGFLGFYDHLWWWDHLIHIFASTLIAVLGTVLLLSVELHADSLYLPGKFISIFILMFVMAIGVIWEMYEYTVDTFFGTSMQYNLNDTIIDLISNMFGGIIAAILGHKYFHPLAKMIRTPTKSS
ncbi:MAG: hypothetical protein ACOC85_03555 [Thermoplasmatota archaeon]